MSNKSEQALLEAFNNEVRSAAMPGIVFVSMLCVLGFFGNLLVLYVFLFRYKSCNFRYFVLCLCLTDLTSSLTTIPGEAVTQLFWYTYPYPMVCKVKSFFNVFTVCAEAFCLLTISVDRHRKVCKPHSWQIRPRVSLGLCIGVYAVAFILALPVSFFWGTHTETLLYQGRNVTVTKCEKDQAYVYSVQPVIYSASVQAIVSVSLVVMLVLYVLVASTLFKNKKTNLKPVKHSIGQSDKCQKRPNAYTLSPLSKETKPEVSESGYSTYTDTEQGNGSASMDTDGELRTEDETFTNSDFDTLAEENSQGKKQPKRSKRRSKRKTGDMASRIQRKTRITFILSIVFIITTILYFTLLDLIAENILPKLSAVEKAVYFFFFRLVFINHVINPVVYGLLDPQFRKEMKKIPRRIINNFKCCCQRD